MKEECKCELDGFQGAVSSEHCEIHRPKDPVYNEFTIENRMVYNKAEDWREEYPLNTFQGETKKELIAFIEKVRTEALEDIKEKIKALKVATQEQTGSFKYDACYEECEEVINEKLK
jgi:hypothetical protein